MSGTVTWAVNRATDSRYQFATLAGLISAIVVIVPSSSTIATVGIPVLQVGSGTVLFIAGMAVGYAYTDHAVDRWAAIRWSATIAGFGVACSVVGTALTEAVVTGWAESMAGNATAGDFWELSVFGLATVALLSLLAFAGGLAGYVFFALAGCLGGYIAGVL